MPTPAIGICGAENVVGMVTDGSIFPHLMQMAYAAPFN